MNKGPILKFLIKRELSWVPVIGWACLAMNFPRLNRGSGNDARASDYTSIQTASHGLSDELGALLVFAEGTRFTERKREAQQSPYLHLLKPRVGGVKILRDTASPQTPVLDITIRYERGVRNFWQCLRGEVKRIDISIEHFTLGDIKDVSEWLEARWEVKEKRLEDQLR